VVTVVLPKIGSEIAYDYSMTLSKRIKSKAQYLYSLLDKDFSGSEVRIYQCHMNLRIIPNEDRLITLDKITHAIALCEKSIISTTIVA
jgi:hypothetical protein